MSTNEVPSSSGRTEDQLPQLARTDPRYFNFLVWFKLKNPRMSHSPAMLRVAAGLWGMYSEEQKDEFSINKELKNETEVELEQKISEANVSKAGEEEREPESDRDQKSAEDE